MKHINKIITSIVCIILTLPSFAQVATNIGNANVASGNISISSNASQTTITQTTAKGIINWDSFNVPTSHTVVFQVPNSSSITLNRVASGNPSMIFGNIQSNGQVWLLNPDGITFANGSQVNVFGILASTHNILDADFINSTGSYHFNNAGAGILMNSGNITASSYAILAGTRVGNSGTIEVNLGKIVLGVGNEFSVDFAGDGLLNFEITDSSLTSQIRANGTSILQADGGTIIITAAKANEIIGGVVNVGGLVQANTVNTVSGQIVITAGTIMIPANAIYSTSGADGQHSDGAGAIILKADNVNVMSGATLSALSDYYDGTITIGDVASTSITVDPAATVVYAARYQMPPPVVTPTVVTPTVTPQSTTTVVQQLYTLPTQTVQTAVIAVPEVEVQTVITPSVTTTVAKVTTPETQSTTVTQPTDVKVTVNTNNTVVSVSLDNSTSAAAIGSQTIAPVTTPTSPEDSKDPVLASVSTIRLTSGSGIKLKQQPVTTTIIPGILSLETIPPRVSSKADDISLSGSGNRSRW